MAESEAAMLLTDFTDEVAERLLALAGPGSGRFGLVFIGPLVGALRDQGP